MGNRLILFDTCNYRNYPVGGQLTSISNFLRYVSEKYPKKTGNILLVGVSTVPEDIGIISLIQVNDRQMHFLAVTQAVTDQNAVKKSLRVEYLKGLFKYKKDIGLDSMDCAYVHTPEAFQFVHMASRKTPCYVFSHGTYMNMYKRVRFFKKMPLVRFIFQQYLLMLIKKCDCIFVLEKETEVDYRKYNKNVVHVGNSIVCSEFLKHTPDFENLKIIFAGRLSAGKNVGPIIEAIKAYKKNCTFTILGAGEKLEELQNIANERIVFAGAVPPAKAREYMKESDILIMNSDFEGIPMTILEAISLSLPVITTDVGGIKEVLNYGSDSEKTDGTPQSILYAIDKITDQYQEYSRAAYQRSLDFDYKKMNGRIFDEINKKLKW